MKQMWRGAIALVAASFLAATLTAPASAADAGSPAVTTAVATYQDAFSNYTRSSQALAASAGSGQKAIQAAFQDAQKAYNQANQAYTQAAKAISAAFANDISTANKTAKQAMRAANTAELKNQVNSSLAAAIAGATARRDAALSQLTPLGPAPTKPNATSANTGSSQNGSQSGSSSTGSSGTGTSGSGSSGSGATGSGTSSTSGTGSGDNQQQPKGGRNKGNR